MFVPTCDSGGVDGFVGSVIRINSPRRKSDVSCMDIAGQRRLFRARPDAMRNYCSCRLGIPHTEWNNSENLLGTSHILPRTAPVRILNHTFRLALCVKNLYLYDQYLGEKSPELLSLTNEISFQTRTVSSIPVAANLCYQAE